MVCRLPTPSVAFSARDNRLRITTSGWVGAQRLKEVARVISINNQKTAQTPTFGASAYGQTSLEVPAISAVAGVQVSTCARSRHIGGGMALATKGDFPGTSAWRPPTC
jgi:hypothetical protein